MTDLKTFCGGEFEIRSYLREPWTADGWTYYTNGHVCVRVPAGEGAAYVPGKHPKNVADLFTKWLDETPGDFMPIPALPALVKCAMCDGTGIWRATHEDEDDDVCLNCLGTLWDWTFHPLGDTGFSLLYLHQLAALPNARIRPNGANAAAVLFDGGQALLMPMKERRNSVAPGALKEQA